MKKVILTILFIIVLTGCSNEKMVCTKKENDNGIISKDEYTLKYDKDKLQQYKLVSTYEFNDMYTEEEINEQKKKAEETCEYFKEESNNNVKCILNIKNRTITVEVSTDLKNIDKDSFENLMFVPLDDLNNKKETKKMFKNAGFTCK